MNFGKAGRLRSLDSWQARDGFIDSHRERRGAHSLRRHSRRIRTVTPKAMPPFAANRDHQKLSEDVTDVALLARRATLSMGYARTQAMRYLRTGRGTPLVQWQFSAAIESGSRSGRGDALRACFL